MEYRCSLFLSYHFVTYCLSLAFLQVKTKKRDRCSKVSVPVALGGEGSLTMLLMAMISPPDEGPCFLKIRLRTLMRHFDLYSEMLYFRLALLC